MSPLAGIFGPDAEREASRLRHAVARSRIPTLALGSLQVACEHPRSQSDTLCLIDGVIDNVQALARELAMDSASPVESLLASAYKRWGRSLLPRLRGDFVLLIWDRASQRGMIARDQLGVRCLYLSEQASHLIFASELGDLLKLLPRRPGPDPAGVAHWLAISSRAGDGTLYEGVRRLAPGSLLLLERDCVHEQRYYSPRFSEPLRASPAELAELVADELDRAVSRRIDPDSLTCVLMSGGLDSAAVASAAAHAASGRVRAYSATFPEHPQIDESALIDELAHSLGLEGVIAEVRPGGLIASALESQASSHLPLLAWGDFWALPLLRRAASEGAGTVLGGDGGDELFGVRAYLLADELTGGRPRTALSLAMELPGAGARPPRRQVASAFAELAILGALPPRPHAALQARAPSSRAPAWLLPAGARLLRESQDRLAWKHLDGPRWWSHIAYGLTRGVEQNGIFEHQRQRAMLAGLQARHPLLDLDLVQLALTLPPRTSFDRDLNRPQLRASLAGRVPDTIRLRPAKAWFDSLIVDCMRGPDRYAIDLLLRDPRAELHAHVDLRSLTQTLLDRGPDRYLSRFSWMHQMWRLLSAECWLRTQAGARSDLDAVRASVSGTQLQLSETGANARRAQSIFPP